MNCLEFPLADDCECSLVAIEDGLGGEMVSFDLSGSCDEHRGLREAPPRLQQLICEQLRLEFIIGFLELRLGESKPNGETG